MTVAEKLKAEEDLRRLEDVQDRLVEAIGELLARRASRKAHLSDPLDSLRITPIDLYLLGSITAKFAEDDEGAPDYQTAYDQAAEMNGIVTVADLAAELMRWLYPKTVVAP